MIDNRLERQLAGLDRDGLIFTWPTGDTLRASNLRRDVVDPAMTKVGLDGVVRTDFDRRPPASPVQPT